MTPRTLPFTATQLLATVHHEIALGVKESPAGSNRQKYGVWFGWDGVPWCAIGTVWCFAHTIHGVDLRRREWLGGGNTLASTPAMHHAANLAGWRDVPVSKARAGDIVFWGFPGPGINHVSTAVGPPKAGLLVTYDFNSGPSSQNNGGMACVRIRSTSSVRAVVRPPYSATTAIAQKVAIALTLAGIAVAGMVVPKPHPAPAPKPSASRTIAPAPKPAPNLPAKPTPSKQPAPILHGYLRLGSKGASVTALQRRLRELGYTQVKVTGRYDKVTKVAVTRFQAHAKFPPKDRDGQVGPTTAKALHLRWVRR